MLRATGERGDTMIEVLFAVGIFSLVAIGGLTIMNNGASASQRSLEITLTRQEMDGQAEALRMLYDEAMEELSAGVTGNATTQWARALAKRKSSGEVTTLQELVQADGETCSTSLNTNKAFIVNVKSLTIEDTTSLTPESRWRSAQTYPRISYSGASSSISGVEGLWIEAARSPSAADAVVPGYVEFHIRACWKTSGQSRPITLGTVVRLYVPKA